MLMTPPKYTARRMIAALIAVVGAIVWTHSLAGVLRAVRGIAVEDVAAASVGLTIAAVVTALAASIGFASLRRASTVAFLSALTSVGVVTLLHPPALFPTLALIPVGVVSAVIGTWLSRRLPASLDTLPAARPKIVFAWCLIAVIAVVQVGRLATYMTDADSNWFLSTPHPFYAKHECASAYVYGAELSKRHEPNIYDSAHYPGLNPDAKPETKMRGMKPEDPFQYAPQFLLWPRLGIEVTHDYDALRLVWFGANVTLCITAVLVLSAWIGGSTGMAAGLLVPVMLVSFPVLHNFQYGQFHFAAIGLAILALLAFQRRRPALGGTLLAISILSKLFPAVVLVPLAVQKRWRELAWTAGAGVAITAIAFAVLGPAPFVAFLDYHLPRLSDGSAFAFDKAWPEIATLVTIANQGIYGIVHKIGAMGVSGADTFLARTANLIYVVALFGVSILVGMRTKHVGRAERAVAWLGLLGLASLSSTGAWADYVPLTCVWVLTLLIPIASGRRLVTSALVACGVMQVFLLGTMPIGAWSNGSWLLPVSLFGALAMLISFAGAALSCITGRVGEFPRSEPRASETAP